MGTGSQHSPKSCALQNCPLKDGPSKQVLWTLPHLHRSPRAHLSNLCGPELVWVHAPNRIPFSDRRVKNCISFRGWQVVLVHHHHLRCALQRRKDRPRTHRTMQQAGQGNMWRVPRECDRRGGVWRQATIKQYARTWATSRSPTSLGNALRSLTIAGWHA